MTAAKTEMTWTMSLTETEERVDISNAFGEPLKVHFFAVLEGDGAVLNVDQLDGRELKGLRYGETYELTLRRKSADGARGGKRPVKEFAWTEHMFPHGPSEDAAVETIESLREVD